MSVVDTHALIWLRTGDARPGTGARRALDDALSDEELAVSAMTFWEVAMLGSKGRLDSPEDGGMWRRELILQGLTDIPVDGEIGTRANALPGFHADPADRIIVATAQAGHRLVTGDERILAGAAALPGSAPGSSGAGTLGLLGPQVPRWLEAGAPGGMWRMSRSVVSDGKKVDG